MHNDVRIDTGEMGTAGLVCRIIDEELAAIRAEVSNEEYGSRRFDDARQLFEQVALANDFGLIS